MIKILLALTLFSSLAFAAANDGSSTEEGQPQVIMVKSSAASKPMPKTAKSTTAKKHTTHKKAPKGSSTKNTSHAKKTSKSSKDKKSTKSSTSN